MFFTKKYLAILSSLLLISGSTTFAVIAYQNSDYDNQYLLLNDKITTGQSSIKKQQNTYSEILPSLSSKIKSKQLPTVNDYITRTPHTNTTSFHSDKYSKKTMNNNTMPKLATLEDNLRYRYDEQQYVTKEQDEKLPSLKEQIKPEGYLPTIDDMV
ncbi:MAG: hypothetical protein IJU54_00605 [Alphaproteobacteria bacterium]|nr:hypothetical protein [Alphaproteobacteria bacterium]